MCTDNCIDWGKNIIKEIDIKGRRIIEVGSLFVNGSLRDAIQLLKPKEYVGIDIIEGTGVDVICPAEELAEKFGENSFDVVISTCTLEHIEDWKAAVSNIKNICKPNGLMFIIVPKTWHYHAYPCDFWRFKKKDIEAIFDDCEIVSLEEEQGELSLVYAKIRKPKEFKEKDLSNYELYKITN